MDPCNNKYLVVVKSSQEGISYLQRNYHGGPQ